MIVHTVIVLTSGILIGAGFVLALQWVLKREKPGYETVGWKFAQCARLVKYIDDKKKERLKGYEQP